ncbi:MAG: adenosylmethionine--8-amino-7-oxononanoate transaminase [Myxococcales bacterium]|nr:adenosylmethionine--8-amino-7-oxononanoate transaminase [Myxococcales bacterium]
MATLEDRDRAVLWHPATHFADLERLPPIAVERARGCWLEDAAGRRILDAISSWWTCIHGHGHPAIAAAVARQAANLDHVMFAGFTHAPAVELAEALLAAAPPGYGRVFYADCGSAAVEVALKLSYQRRRQTGELARTRFATLTNSYHGETLGALALCGSGVYRDTFQPLLMDVLELPAPAFPRHPAVPAGDLGADTPEAERAVALLAEHAASLTALVVEPLVQCAGRMAMPGLGFYQKIVKAAQDLGIDVIADEIAVGFGRTGRLFASAWAPGLRPDFLCLSKGLAGVLPLAAVLIREGFEDAFTGSPARSFLHSHTFTANPIACAAALAGLALLGPGQADGLLARLPARVTAMARRREAVAAACPAIVAHRQCGMIAAFTVDGERAPADGRLGLELRAAALARGVLLRPLHDTVYWLPPLVIADDELDTLAHATVAAIDAVLGR